MHSASKEPKQNVRRRTKEKLEYTSGKTLTNNKASESIE